MHKMFFGVIFCMYNGKRRGERRRLCFCTFFFFFPVLFNLPVSFRSLLSFSTPSVANSLFFILYSLFFILYSLFSILFLKANLNVVYEWHNKEDRFIRAHRDARACNCGTRDERNQRFAHLFDKVIEARNLRGGGHFSENGHDGILAGLELNEKSQSAKPSFVLAGKGDNRV